MSLKKFKIAVYAVTLSVTLLLLNVFSSCADNSKKIKITVGIRNGASAFEQAFYEECKKSFEEKFPQYEVITSPYAYTEDTIVAKFTSGQLPTVFEADASVLERALNNGYIRDISKYMNDYGWTEKIESYFLSQITVNGKLCGVPAEQYSAGMVLNLPLLKRAGVLDCNQDGEFILYDDNGAALYPDTFDKIEKASQKIAMNLPSGTFGVFLPSGDEYCGKLFLDLVYNFGSGNLEYIDGEGNWKLSLSHKEFGDAIRWVRQMSQEVYIDDAKSYGVDEWAGKMAKNEVAIAFCQSNQLTAAISAEPLLKNNIAFVPLPTAEDAESCSVWNGKVYVVSARANDEQTEGVFKFLKFLGYGPDTDEQSTYVMKERFEARYSNDIPVFPIISVWRDGDYNEKLQELYDRYKNINEYYYKEFYLGFDKRKRESEPYARESLYSVIDGLVCKMLFEATTSNLVTLLYERETEFTEKHLSNLIEN